MDEPSVSQDEAIFKEVIDINLEERTSDVISDGSFKSLMLSESTIENLMRCGFKKPSPVQLNAIPPGIIGVDMLVQAKSGTGKTLVFSILAIEKLNVQSNATQRLILAPTREIANQIAETIKKLMPKEGRIAVLTGGTSVYEDKEKLKKGVHIIVGTTGRLCQLSNDGALNLNSVDLFVLDEADKMMTDSFEKDVNYLFSTLPTMRQVAVFSATYPPHLATSLSKFLRSAVHIRLNSGDVQLIGIKQYVSFCIGWTEEEAVISLLASIQYKQAFVFCSTSEDCTRICNKLINGGIEAAAISSKLEQNERDAIVKKLKMNSIKVLVSTDLTARGIDAPNVDLVINIEPPVEVETYFHRIGRAARYGAQGASLTLLCQKKSVSKFGYLVEEGDIRAKIIHINDLHPQLTTNREIFDSCPLFVSTIKRNNGDVKNSEDREHEVPSTNIHYSNELDRDTVVNREDEEVNDESKEVIDYSQLLNSAISLSTSLKKEERILKELGGNVEKVEEKPKKFKFVPSRAKKSIKYYMRGEMISIRDGFTVDEWKEYAMTKFNMNEDPFIQLNGINEIDNNSSKEDKDIRKNRKRNGVNDRPSPIGSRDGIKEYTRKDMIAIVKSKNSKIWRGYAESKWDLNEDPFVKEPWMRCSFSERLRIQRQKEKEERDKVIADRKAKRIHLLSMGSIPSSFKIPQCSFKDYCTLLKEQMIESKGNMKRGPYIPKRDNPSIYKERILEANRLFIDYEKQFEYILKRALRSICESDIQTDEVEIMFDEKMNGDGVVENIVDDKENEDEEGEEEEEEYHEYEYGEEGDDDGEEEEEDYDDEENEDSNDSDDWNSVDRFEYSYNRNINFATVFNAYLNTYSSFR